MIELIQNMITTNFKMLEPTEKTGASTRIYLFSIKVMVILLAVIIVVFYFSFMARFLAIVINEVMGRV
jgi:hypothetical protein